MPANSDKDEQIASRKILAERLRDAREYLGFSQEEVSKYLGIPRTALSNIENAQRGVDATELSKLAKLYKRSISELTGEEEIDVDQDIQHIARQAAELSTKDREELLRFVAYLKARK